MRALDKLMVMRKEAITRDSLGLTSPRKPIAKKRKEENGREEASDKAL